MTITTQDALQRVIEHREIFFDEMVGLMRSIMRGEVSPTLTAAILTGLRVKKETVGEIAAAATVLREFARPVEVADRTHLVDIVGTGGDGAHTFNISTASMFVAAAAGARVAKHGNRSVSSKSGSADALEALGADIELQPEQVAACIARCGIGFMYAPIHHPAMKVVAPVRREMGVRTLFNILGPLTNPAGAPSILMGVFHPDLVGIQVRVLQELGAERALVVWGRDGMDEISLGAGTLVGELRDGQVREYEIHPEDFGIPMAASRNLRVADPAESKAMMMQALENVEGLPREIVAYNAGAALYVAGVAEDIGDGIARARPSPAARRGPGWTSTWPPPARWPALDARTARLQAAAMTAPLLLLRNADVHAPGRWASATCWWAAARCCGSARTRPCCRRCWRRRSSIWTARAWCRASSMAMCT